MTDERTSDLDVNVVIKDSVVNGHEQLQDNDALEGFEDSSSEKRSETQRNSIDSDESSKEHEPDGETVHQVAGSNTEDVVEDETSLVGDTRQPNYSTFPPGPDSAHQQQGGCFGHSIIMLRVYTSHGLSAWGDRMWSFAVGLFLIILYPDSLQLSASYGLSASLSVILLGELLGRWVDRTSRLKAARTALVFSNGSVAVCAALVVATFLYQDTVGPYIGLVYAVIIVQAVIANLASIAQKITMEKDWIVVIADGDKDRLAAMNAVFRTIDLTTYTVAPVLVGQLMTFTSPATAALVIAIWNLVSLVIEYYLLHNLYKALPSLARKRVVDTQNTRTIAQSFKHYIDGWGIYFKQEGRYAGMGLSCLYMTVLGFDSITVGYAYAQGISGSIIGVVTAVGAVFGILGSITYPFLRSRVGLERTGLMGFLCLVSTLSLCVASVFTSGSPFDISSLKNIGNINNSGNSTSLPLDGSAIRPGFSYLSIILLLSGVVLARFGLWVSDLSITQIVQECVAESERGVVAGIQNSLNMIMDTIKFALVVLLPLQQQFGFLVLLSFGFICLGWLFYALYSRSKRGHILPFHKNIASWRTKTERRQQSEEVS